MNYYSNICKYRITNSNNPRSGDCKFRQTDSPFPPLMKGKIKRTGCKLLLPFFDIFCFESSFFFKAGRYYMLIPVN